MENVEAPKSWIPNIVRNNPLYVTAAIVVAIIIVVFLFYMFNKESITVTRKSAKSKKDKESFRVDELIESINSKQEAIHAN